MFGSWRQWRQRLLGAGLAALVLSAVGTGALAAPLAPVAGSTVTRPVVLLGTGGLRWDDVGAETPALYGALGQASAGALVVRSVRSSTCPVDGWLAVSAGRRAADSAPAPDAATPDCRVPQAPAASPGGPGVAPDWQVYRAEAADGHFDADPGLLGSTLEASGVARAAVGAGALIATADRSGRTPLAWPGLAAGEAGTVDPGADAVGLADQVRAAVASGAGLVAVDLGAVREVPTSDSASGVGPATRAEQVAAVDTRLGLVLDALPDGATVIFASLADSGPRGHLQVITAQGRVGPDSGAARFGPGLLRASSTRQDGLVQSTDLLPSMLTALGVAIPAAAVGSPMTTAPGGDQVERLQRLLDLDSAAAAVERMVTPFFVSYGAIELLVLAGLGWLAHRLQGAPPTRRRVLTVLQAAAVTFALVPVATFTANLLPWWRASPAGIPLTAAVIAGAVPLAPLALLGPWRRALLGPAGMAAALTAAVLTIDLVAGSPLALAALIGGQPIIAGRFYGLSNPTFALFATGALFAAAALAEQLLARGRSPRQAALAVVAVGAAATLIDGAPAWGSDFGGPPALVPAFGLLALWTAGVRVTWSRLLAIAAATVGVLLVLSVADWLRAPNQRTHLGRFVQSVLDGEGAVIVQRKAEQNLGILISTPLTLTVPVAAAVAVAVLCRPRRWHAPALQLAYQRQPLLPATLASLGVLLLLGFLANDSGTSIPPASLMLFAPLLIAITARAVQLEDAERLEHDLRSARRGRPRSPQA